MGPLFDDIANHLRDSRRIVFLTGAGISTASGLADFRSQGGLWDGLDPYQISHPSQIGTQDFREFFTRRILDVDEHSPNDAHRLINEWFHLLEADISILTQNIDGYHRFPDGPQVLEMHGHLRHLFCESCGTFYDTSKYVLFHDDTCELCESKGIESAIRPDVVLFDEVLDPLHWFKGLELAGSADLIFVVGTSLEVFPFNELVRVGKDNGAKLIILTNSETPYDNMADLRLYDDIVETIRSVDQALRERIEA